MQRVAIESRMTHISGFDRCQLLLLPEAIDDYVGSDNPVRFIDAFVDRLDLAAVGFERVTPKATGRPFMDGTRFLIVSREGLDRRGRRRLCHSCSAFWEAR